MSQRVNKSILGLLIAVSLVASTTTLRAADSSQDIPITDPALLERLGFDPGAADVYATPMAYEELLLDPTVRAADEEARIATHLAERHDQGVGGPYGTSTPGYTSITGHAFVPTFPNTEHTLFAGAQRYCTSGRPFLEAQLNPGPHGARLGFVYYWYWDSNSDEDLEVALYRLCQPAFGPGSPVVTLLGSVESAGVQGSAWTFIEADETIAADECTYYARVRLDGSNASCDDDETLRIQKVRAQWLRQVSPPPDDPTFSDVPTTHLFFRHIEALAASGITGGCGGDEFCPGASVTRAQMAAFLATALGLHWE